MFESLMSSISQTFADIWPSDFCVECFLKGFGEGIVGGVLTVAALAVIASISAPLAVVVAVGFAVYGVVTLASKWHQMSDGQKSEAIGGFFGGLVAGGATSGGMTVPGLAPMVTSTGEVSMVMTAVSVPAVTGQSAAAAAMGANVAMMSGGSGGGGGGDDGGSGSGNDDQTPPKSPPEKSVSYPDKQSARKAFSGSQQKAANKFFGGATGKCSDFKTTPTPEGGQQMEFTARSNTPGYKKVYVQEIDSNGGVVREYKDTMAPDGSLVQRKWVHGGPK